MLHALMLVTLAGLVATEFDPELHAKYLTMPESSFIEYFNAQDYSWKMAEYDNVQQKHLACAHLDNKSVQKLALEAVDLEGIQLPDNFDARQQWPQCESIKKVSAQGTCGSCWTFGSGMTASDRTCIHKGINVQLAEQDFECMQKGVCEGGLGSEAFEFWRDQGLVTRKCKPYNITKLKEETCSYECVNNTDVNYKNDKHFAEKVYGISSNSTEIKAELFKNGPIEAGFFVYQDFGGYKSGIYEHKFGNITGYHIVRIIGYGVENETDYWLVANSWGSTWGDKGWFRIKPFQPEINFEDSLNTGLPKN